LLVLPVVNCKVKDSSSSLAAVIHPNVTLLPIDPVSPLFKQVYFWLTDKTISNAVVASFARHHSKICAKPSLREGFAQILKRFVSQSGCI
jgi:hypothetical protein